MKTILLCVVALSASNAYAASAASPLDSLYRQAQREFNRKNYDQAQELLQKYLEQGKKKRYKRERLFWVIDQIGRIFLRHEQDPDGAIRFFERLGTDKRLTDAEQDMVDGWISAAKDWKALGQLPRNAQSANELYRRGEQYYKKGVALTQFPGDDSGNAYLHIAASYLVPFITNFDADPRIGEALVMMGDIRRRSWTDAGYWSDNFYLREAIRRFPHTKLAQRAYDMLEKDVRFGYTGSSGDNTPKSLRMMLQHFKKLAAPPSK